MSKYVDLADTIYGDGVGAYQDEIRSVLEWLDARPDQVPGRTVTAGEVGRWSHLINGRYIETPAIIDFLEALGIIVAPDPEPTNFERLEDLVDQWRKGPHYKTLTQYLDDCGVKAPGGNDE